MIQISISIGELIDKITILKIKKKFIKLKDKLLNVDKELNILEPILKIDKINSPKIQKLTEQLYEINLKLWEIEDKLREKERMSDFDEEFISLARSVYFTNDKRAEIKKDINIISGSQLVEEKSYSNYYFYK